MGSMKDLLQPELRPLDPWEAQDAFFDSGARPMAFPAFHKNIFQRGTIIARLCGKRKVATAELRQAVTGHRARCSLERTAGHCARYSRSVFLVRLRVAGGALNSLEQCGSWPSPRVRCV